MDLTMMIRTHLQDVKMYQGTMSQRIPWRIADEMQAMPSGCQTSVFQIKDFTGLRFVQAVFSKFQAAKKFIKILEAYEKIIEKMKVFT